MKLGLFLLDHEWNYSKTSVTKLLRVNWLYKLACQYSQDHHVLLKVLKRQLALPKNLVSQSC